MSSRSTVITAFALLAGVALARAGGHLLRDIDFPWGSEEPQVTAPESGIDRIEIVERSQDRTGSASEASSTDRAEDCVPEWRSVRRIVLSPEEAEQIFGPINEQGQKPSDPEAHETEAAHEPTVTSQYYRYGCPPKRRITITPELWEEMMRSENESEASVAGTEQTQSEEPKP